MENLFEELIFTLENIGHLVQEIDSKIAEVVQQCRCKKILHRPIHHLSGGEKQKAALAVLFAMNLGSISWMNPLLPLIEK